MTGRSIRIYLVDGDASGLMTAEVMNWSGKFLVAPRTMLKELAKREEITRTGIYVLAGPDPENPSQDMIYVGEGDNVFKRIAAHDKDVDKEFWVRCVAVISEDLNLKKGHVRYLESRLIEKGHASGRARLVNGTAPPLPPHRTTHLRGSFHVRFANRGQTRPKLLRSRVHVGVRAIAFESLAWCWSELRIRPRTQPS